ncbi:MAG: hypothetical protein ACRCZ0_08295 [Cetobacterium sp.]
MANWGGQNNIRNFKIFNVSPNTPFNIETMGGPGKFKNPKILHTFLKVVAETTGASIGSGLRGEYPMYTIQTGRYISKDSVVQILVFENETQPPIETSTPKAGTWTTVATIGRMEVVDVDFRSGYILDLDARFGYGTFTKGNYHIFPIITRLALGDFTKGYDLTPVNQYGNVWKIDLTTNSADYETKVTKYYGNITHYFSNKAFQVHVQWGCRSSSPTKTVSVSAVNGTGWSAGSEARGGVFGYVGASSTDGDPVESKYISVSFGGSVASSFVTVYEYLKKTEVAKNCVISCIIIGGV